jgi:hypothetical protein
MPEEITLNLEQRLYVIPCGKGYTCHGFDVVATLSLKLHRWLRSRAVSAVTQSPFPRDWEPTNGTLEAYADYQTLCKKAQMYCLMFNEKCNIELLPILVGLDGRRVEVWDHDGRKRRFIVGKSTGWMPIHLEIHNRRSHGGPACDSRGYESVREVSR